MQFKEVNKLLYPVYIYFILFGVYYLYLTKLLYQFGSDLLTNTIFYTMLIGLPVLVLILVNIRLIIKFKKANYLTIFLLSALPGLIAGAWLGYGMHGAHFFPPSTIIGLIKALTFIGLLGAVIFGILGVLINLIHSGFRKLIIYHENRRYKQNH